MNSGLKRFFQFRGDKAFFELRIVQMTFACFGLLAAVSAVVISWNSELSWNFDYHGWNHLITVYKVPLGILATLIPLVALLAANHRSVQTNEQIRVTVSNNNFQNYFRHIEQFEKFVESRPDVANYVRDKSSLHTSLFPNARSGDLAVSENIIFIEEGIIKMLDERVRKLDGSSWKEAIRELHGILGIAESHFDEMGLRIYSSGSKQTIPIPGPGGKKLALTQGDVSSLFKEIGATFEALCTLASFDTTFKPSGAMHLAISKLKGAPSYNFSRIDTKAKFKYNLWLNG
ncbi:hypothetical protein PSI9734_01643 [Pseudidiomarina piscicola]|uniref:Uncharacterized protein n=1 Tax=Pseudidiomarina piscicola TaxID=2614830 RepID=A0A6S6WNT6_9GAMM|nr:hypothetical protein [Pseudidiomarina piscicola]CAB0151230.1 hypothetical protein PSI9734_01643 [Pseudidiomarina piscicola]VZT40736.1 hypothetical protein PSI9734_01643 [Pseudomonas aeruginosa]